MEAVRYLSPRLEEVLALAASCAGQWEEGVRVAADIGCDHGYTSIELVRRGIADRVIAADVREGPLKKAGEHITEAGLANIIELRLGSGLSVLRPGETGLAIMTGMGGRLIRDLLTQSDPVELGIRWLILGPQSELYETRRFIRERGFSIADERLVVDAGKEYELFLTDTSHGDEAAADEDDQRVYDRYGRLLLERGDPVLRDMLVRREAVINEVLSQVPRDAARYRELVA